MLNDDAKIPVLLVHGLIGSLRDLVPVFAASGISAHAPDLIGYGAHRSAAPDAISLLAQVEHLLDCLDLLGLDRVHIVGHSVGGAIAMLFAHGHGDRVASIINVEGNFSLADAFWSASVARMAPDEAERMMADFRADLPAWLKRSGIAPEPHYLAAADLLLSNQPASTVQATARSVVAITGEAAYEAALRSVFAGPLPIHLVAGEQSRSGWAVPDWACAQAASETLLPGGHLMMVEDPQPLVSAISGLIS